MRAFTAMSSAPRASVALLLLAAGAFALPPRDRVAAIVHDQAILASEVHEAVVASLEADAQRTGAAEASPQAYERMLERMIEDRIVLARARLDTMQVSDADVDRRYLAQLEKLQERTGGAAQFEQMLRQRMGLTMGQYRTRLQKQIRESMLREQVRQKYVGQIEPSREDILAFYAQYKDTLPVLPDQVKISQIRIKIEPSEAKDLAARKEADSAIAQLRAGAGFAQLAAEMSEDPGSRGNGGDIGFFRRGELDPAYEKAALALDAGQYTQRPVRSRFGWHVIELVQKRDQEFRTRHILRMVLADAADTLRAKAVADSLVRAIRAGSSFEAIARQYSDDKSSAAFGGTLGWFSRERMRDEQPQFAQILEKIPEGEVGEPVPSGDGYLIFRVDQRAFSRRMSPEEDWPQLSGYAATILAERRLTEHVSRWRQKFYVEKKMDGAALHGLFRGAPAEAPLPQAPVRESTQVAPLVPPAETVPPADPQPRPGAADPSVPDAKSLRDGGIAP